MVMDLRSLTGRINMAYAAAAILVLALASAFFVVLAAPQARGAVNHGQLVPESVRRDLPIVVDGRVRAHAQVGNRIFVGGDFTQVELRDGSVVDQACLLYTSPSPRD